MLEDKYWKKLFIFLSTIPISVCLNALRIAIIGLTVDIWGQQMAEGFIHSFEGWVIFAACLLLLGLETWILMHIGKAHGKFRYDYFSLPRNFSFQHFSIQPNLALTTLFITFLLALFFGTDLLDAIPEKPPIHKDFNSFPTTFGNWKGHQERLSPEVLDALQLNDYWLADYKNQTTSSFINLYIAYYASQKVGVTTHSPSNCIPGGGWVISESRISSVQLDDGTQVKITRLLIKKDQTTQLVYYWFDERGRDLVETTYAKWYLMWDSIFMHRSDGALIRLVTPVQDQEGHEADVRLQEFLRKIYPTIKLFVPGKEAGKDSPKSPQGSLEDVSP